MTEKTFKASNVHDIERVRREAKVEALREMAESLHLPYGSELRPDGSEDPQTGAYMAMAQEMDHLLNTRADQLEQEGKNDERKNLQGK